MERGAHWKRVIAAAAVLVAASWYGMMAVHELGHVLAAVMMGGKVERVVLHPLAISRTDVSGSSSDVMVTAAGPVVGVVFPLAMWGVGVAVGWRMSFLLRFYAGFCLVANGAYLGSAAVMPVGDTEELLRAGVSVWVMTIAGCAAVVGGLVMWNGMGRVFAERGGERAALMWTWGVLGTLMVGMMLLMWVQ